MGNMLTKDEILAASDIDREMVDVPEWGGAVYVRCLTAAERDTYEQSLVELSKTGKQFDVQPKFANIKARLMVMCLVNEAGDRIFDDEDADTLGTKSAAVMDRLYEVAERLSGLRPGDVEELMGNSESDQSADSPSA